VKISGNTILITGGGSGIGRALAEALLAKGNTVIIAGRRESLLKEVVAANPGMHFLTLDVADPDNIRSFAEEATSQFPGLNVLINNAGIMKAEDITSAPNYLSTAEETVVINLLGPIRLTAALLPHIQQQANSAIVTMSSGLAFVPMAMTPTYSATKAAIHSYSISLRHQLQGSTEVIEIAPPYVQTELMGEHQASDPNAMPLAAFIEEVMYILETEPAVAEVIVERCKPLRFVAENGKMDTMFGAINAARQ
jgi:uncharacterized oxidoreductase